MAHLTEVVESRSALYDMETNALGFWTKPMGYCALVAVFWDQHGSLYGHGRAQHCSGGLGALQVGALFAGIAAPQLTVIVYGLSNEMLSGDNSKLSDLEAECGRRNCPIRTYTATTAGSSVLTNAGVYQPKSDYDEQQQPAAENENKGRCCIIM